MSILSDLVARFRSPQSQAERYARQLDDARNVISGPAGSKALRPLIRQGTATLADPVSQMCTAAQFSEPAYAHWCKAMGVGLHMHRKQWEFVFILHSLHVRGAIKAGARGLGFGVGREPLPAVFAARGCEIVATDLAAEDERAQAWHDTSQHVSDVENLIWPRICPPETVRRQVTFRPVDMTNIPSDLRDFDFNWSSCAFEHLGSIAAGLRFIEKTMDCLKPGGLSVHTTELNLSSNRKTVDNLSTVLFRRRDFEELALRLTEQGHEVMPLCFDSGDQPLDRHVDLPPYSANDHLRLALHDFVSTSFGIVVRKAG